MSNRITLLRRRQTKEGIAKPQSAWEKATLRGVVRNNQLVFSEDTILQGLVMLKHSPVAPKDGLDVSGGTPDPELNPMMIVWDDGGFAGNGQYIAIPHNPAKIRRMESGTGENKATESIMVVAEKMRTAKETSGTKGSEEYKVWDSPIENYSDPRAFALVKTRINQHNGTQKTGRPLTIDLRGVAGFEERHLHHLQDNLLPKDCKIIWVTDDYVEETACDGTISRIELLPEGAEVQDTNAATDES
jgi:hypothetical protein